MRTPGSGLGRQRRSTINPSLTSANRRKRRSRPEIAGKRNTLMMQKRYAILRRDLSGYPVTELHGIAHYVQTLDGLFNQANITSDMEILDDLEIERQFCAVISQDTR